MGVMQIIALAAASLAIGRFGRGSKLLLLIVSAGVIYWVQPSTPLRQLDYWLPTLAFSLTVLTWAAAAPPGAGLERRSLPGILAVAGIAAATSISRDLGPLCCLTATRPPPVAAAAAAIISTALVAALIRAIPGARRFFSYALLFLLLILFIVLKTPSAAESASAAVRTLTGQPVELAGQADLVWLGYSFLAFRLIHILRDEQLGRLPSLTYQDLAAYALFFPTWTAGPIDRIQRWSADASQQPTAESALQSPASDRLEGGRRLLIGLFKKFVLADSLAVFALNPLNAAQTTSPLWMWVLLLGYTLRIYLDFSGYTDVAIGLGRLIGFRLPENFDRPYLKTNLTAFWNSWHITLAQWFRAYFFNPLTRSLRMGKPRLPVGLIIWISQVSVMALIGLWHGVTWNFLIWGLWHGMGLFVHNRWSDWLRPRTAMLDERPRLQTALRVAGWSATFLFVSLGWVWFALPDPPAALHVFTTLVGFQGAAR